MEFFEVLKKRHSIRAYQNKPVEEEKLTKILEAANSSPSAGNLQAREIFLIRDETKKQLLAQAAYGQDFIAEAPVVLVFCSNPSRSSSKYGKRGEYLYSLQDATISASYAQLSATALGLSTVWIGAFDDKEVLKVLGNPEGLLPVTILLIGYPAEKPYATSRRKLEDLVHEV
jgi:nitroreductase